MLILSMLIIITTTVLQTSKVSCVSTKLFPSQLKDPQISFNISFQGKVQTASLSGGSESLVPGGIQAEHEGSLCDDIVKGLELLIEV